MNTSLKFLKHHCRPSLNIHEPYCGDSSSCSQNKATWSLWRFRVSFKITDASKSSSTTVKPYHTTSFCIAFTRKETSTTRRRMHTGYWIRKDLKSCKEFFSSLPSKLVKSHFACLPMMIEWSTLNAENSDCRLKLSTERSSASVDLVNSVICKIQNA